MKKVLILGGVVYLLLITRVWQWSGLEALALVGLLVLGGLVLGGLFLWIRLLKWMWNKT